MKKTAIITGAGSGIGEATAKLFSENGYQVVLVGRKKEKLEKVAKTLSQPSLCLAVDVTSPGGAETIISETVKWAGSFQVLVNNAGTLARASVSKNTAEIWDEMFQVHLMAPSRLMQACIPVFEKLGGGAIVNVSTSGSLRPVPGLSAYSSMKAALNYLTQTAALELAKKNIRVNAVCPGVVETNIFGLNKLPPEERTKSLEGMAQMHPLKRIGQPLDIARAIYDLAKPESSWTTGVLLPVDGGITLQ